MGLLRKVSISPSVCLIGMRCPNEVVTFSSFLDLSNLLLHSHQLWDHGKVNAMSLFGNNSSNEVELSSPMAVSFLFDLSTSVSLKAIA